MKKVLVICFSDLVRDPRVNRQIRFLNDEYSVTTAGTGNSKIDGVKHIDCRVSRKKLFHRIVDGSLLINAARMLSKNYEKYYWDQPQISYPWSKLIGLNFDVIIANDIETLPLALRVANGARVIFDAHEYAPKQNEDLLLWRFYNQKFIEYLCKAYISKADAMMTVCHGLAGEYERNYGIKPTVLTNAPDYENVEPHASDPQKIRIIYHGGATSGRKIENMIKMMEYLDSRFELDLILVPGNQRYIEKMMRLAKSYNSIQFLQPRPMQELVKFSNQYDIGLYLLEPTNFNNKHALPNKLFEFIQARLAVAIGPSPEMANIVKKYDCGVVSDDFSPKSLANCILQLDNKKIDYFKKQSNKIARVMSSEVNKERMLKIIDEVIQK